MFRAGGFNSYMRHGRSLNSGQNDELSSIDPSGLSPKLPKMLPCLRRVLRPALSLRAGSGLTTSGLINHRAPAVASAPLLVHRCHMGTHPLKESVEPLNSPRGAKEFIYSLHPSERTCLLRELHKFESIAIAQGRSECSAAVLMNAWCTTESRSMDAQPVFLTPFSWIKVMASVMSMLQKIMV